MSALSPISLIDLAGTEAVSTSEVSVAFDVAGFRRALGSFITGVTVVTMLDPAGQPRGLTANSFTSVSLSPPLVLVCVAKSTASAAAISSRDSFAVSVLAEDQEDLSAIFASKVRDKFANVRWQSSGMGNPLLHGAVAWFDCAKHQAVDAGDHTIFIGRVVAFGSTPASPLGYCRGSYVTSGLAQDAVAAAGHPIRVGVILERDGAVALVRSGDGSLHLPSGIRLEPAGDPQSLKGALRQLGLDAELGFLFSVFEETDEPKGKVSIYYRGGLRNEDHDEAVELTRFADIPWDRIADGDERSMLRRFVKERSEDSFGVFAGSKNDGALRKLAGTP